MRLKHWMGGAAATAMALAMSPPAIAQETTSAIRGTVSSDTGEAITGASVVVTHVPTGTVSREATQWGGVFDLRGLRVGGPYTVEVTAPDFQGQRIENVFIRLGTPYRLSVDLEPTVEEIVVTASAPARLQQPGSSTAFSAADIATVVSVGRDVRDIARRDPLVTQDVGGNRGGGGQGGVMIAGSAPRSNRITVDGMQAGDDFGLVTNGLSTLRGPVSLDAISQFSVQAVPFDVANGDFTGGALNMVLREGTNEIEGVVFVNYLNDGLVGERIRQNRSSFPVTQENYGGFLGLPLIKDKLFFAGSYEYYTSADVTLRGLANEGFANTLNGIAGPGTALTRAEFDSVISPGVAGRGYVGNYAVASSFPVGDYLATAPIVDEKSSLRLDWNITDNHRASASYRSAESSLIIRDFPADRGDLSSSWYAAADTEEVYTLQLNSDWTENLSTELRASFRDYGRRQQPASGQEFGAVQICLESALGDIVGSASACTPKTIIDFGPDSNRHANSLDTTNTQFSGTGEYVMGSHLLKAGYQYQGIEIFNLFVPQSDGIFYFDSIDAFNRGRMSRFQFSNTASGDPNDAAAAFSYAIHSLFLQDAWDISDALTVTYGVRYDWYEADDKPAFNPYFTARNGFSNQETYDGLSVIMPRVSFDFDQDWYSVSGGVGLVSGGAPDVFLSNSFSNTGVLTAGVDIQRQASGPCREILSGTTLTTAECAILLDVNKSDARLFFDLPTGTINGAPYSAQTLVTRFDPLNPANAGSPLANSQTVNALHPNFRIPSDWKANLTAEVDWLGFEWSAHLVGTRSNHSVVFTDTKARLLQVANPTAADLAAGVTAGQQRLPDGRLRYDGLNIADADRATRGMLARTNVNGNRDIVAMDATEESWSVTWALGVAREWESLGLGFGLSYARQDGEDYGGYAQFGTTASGFYGEQYADLDPNLATLGRSAGQIEESIKIDVSWEHEFIKDHPTRFSLFGENRTGRPLNFTMGPTGSGRSSVFGVNRGSTTGSDLLLYVPDMAACTGLNCGLVTFATQADLDAFTGIVNRFGLPTGGIVPKSFGNNPDIQQMDLQISQEIPSIFEGHKGRIQLDISNLLNLINSEWGVVEEYTNSRDSGRVTSAECANALGTTTLSSPLQCQRYRYSGVTSSPYNSAPQINANESRWVVQIGLRYEF
ncbi:MAG: TonB-dependent receptor [Hyphomonadaceae bacterium]|nr:TonB-dependent receptor [Hyphomonadaceae bacterium]